jgi:hypothetical protein
MFKAKYNSLTSKSSLRRISAEHQSGEGARGECAREYHSLLRQLAFRHDQSLSRCEGELLYDLFEAFLVRGFYGSKLHADTSCSGPSNRCLADMDGGGVRFNLEEQFDLHAGEGAKRTFQPASFERKVFH